MGFELPQIEKPEFCVSMRLMVLQTKYNERLTSVMRDCLEDLEDDGAHGGVGEGLRALAHQAQ